MSKKADLYHFDMIDFFADSRYIVDISFTLGGELKQTECSIILYDPIRSFLGIRPVNQENESWIIPLKNIELIKSQVL